MSSGNRRLASIARGHTSRRIVMPVVAALIAFGGVGTAHANQASPAASPESMCLTAPASSATPVAELATPISDQAVIDTATAAVQEHYSCLAEAGVEYGEITVDSVSTQPDGSVVVTYQTTLGAQVIAAQATLTESDGTWGVTSLAQITPETDLDTVAISATVSGGIVELSRPSASVMPAVIIHAVNGEDAAVVVLVLKTPEDFDPTTLSLDDPALPEGVSEVGGQTLDAGTEADLIFEGLEDGTYVIVAVLSDGSLATGAAITLTAPVDLDVPDLFATPAP